MLKITVVDYLILRESLRQARHHARVDRAGVQRVGMTLDEAAAKSGLNRATIHSIENMSMEPDLKPEFETIERLVVSYGQKLSTFFASVEVAEDRQTNADYTPESESSTNPTRLHEPQARAPVSTDLALAVGKALIDAGTTITGFAVGVTLEQSRDTVPSLGATKPKGGKRRA